MSTITATTEQAIPAGTWTLDRVHSHVGFAVRHSGISLFKGRVADVDAALADGALTGSAGVGGIEVQDEHLGGHLRSPDFFDAERFPRVRFASTRLDRKGNELTVEGELEMRGVRRPVRLTGAIAGPVGERVGISLTTTIDRTDFGMSWNMELPGGGPVLGNDVELTADLELVREA